MIESTFPLLSLAILLPLLGALTIGLVKTDHWLKPLTLGFASAELIVALWITQQFNPALGDHFQLVEHYRWITSLNIELLLGVDGVSVLFLPFSALLTVIAVLASWYSVQNLPRFHFALLLALEGITIGVFSALDMMLFFLFWELTLPPVFFLIGLWGIGPYRRKAAMKYTLFMLFGGVPILFAIIMLALNYAAQSGGGIPQDLSFSLPALLETPVPYELQTVVFALLLLGFAVKAPLVPFHTWLPTAAMEAPTQMTALLIGLKLGIFGIVRFVLPLAPDAAVEYSGFLGVWGALTLIYGALIALQQSNLRRLLAYLSISHVGLVLIGVASLTEQGLQGGVFQLLNFTVVSAGLMFIAGFIQQRLGSTEAVHLGGLAAVMPQLTAFYFIFALASIGMPGTNGFPAELLLFVGILQAKPGLGFVALLGAVLGAAALFNFIRRIFFGPIVRAEVRQLQDLRRREWGLLCLPALLVLVLGIFPDVIVATQRAAIEHWLNRLLPTVMVMNEAVLSRD